MPSFETEQERFWAGEFGDDYVDRNRGPKLVASNRALFASVLRSTADVARVLGFGATLGQNRLAIRSLLPAAELSATEINAQAVAQLRELGATDVHEGSLLEFPPRRDWHFVLAKGVLIHV